MCVISAALVVALKVPEIWSWRRSGVVNRNTIIGFEPLGTHSRHPPCSHNKNNDQ